MSFDLSATIPRSNRISRILAGTPGQKKKNRLCPPTPRLDGRRALVTGGAAGVAEFVSCGLMERGVQVVTGARGLSRGTASHTETDTLAVDLSDPALDSSGASCLWNQLGGLAAPFLT